MRVGTGLAAAAAMAGAMLLAAPAQAVYWPTEVFLQQEPDDQMVYLIGIVDLYEHVVDEIAPDPNDWMMPCLRRMTPVDLRSYFLTWLLEGDIAKWRDGPAKLFIEAMGDYCNPPAP